MQMTLNNTTTNANRQNEVVNSVYRDSDCVATYANLKLMPAEASAFMRYSDDIVGKQVLDLGCGAGRLAVYLLPLVSAYTGCDISPFMIKYCRERYEAEFYEGDMRDLSLFSNHSFDTVLGVSNLFDAVSHADRLVSMAEVHRILTPGGLLIFSAHNRNYAEMGQEPQLERSRNPLTQMLRLIDYRQACAHHTRLKPHQRFEPEYALINDSGNNYASLHYYISREVQLRQLSDLGFEPLACMDSSGRLLKDNDDDSHSSSVHYVARRRTTGAN